MSKYTQPRTRLLVTLGSSVADNTEILSFGVPANKEIEVYGFEAYVRTGSNSSGATVELVDNSDTVLAEVAVTGSAGALNSDSTGLPFRIASSTSDRVFAIKMDHASGSGTCDVDVCVIMSDPGVA